MANGSAKALPGDSVLRHNSDSKLDSALLKGRIGSSTSTTGAAADAGNVAFGTFDPALPPLAPGPLKLHWHAREAHLRISDDTVVAAWTFEGNRSVSLPLTLHSRHSDKPKPHNPLNGCGALLWRNGPG